jgi:RNA polymerase sigma-70 factor, ECF subfamily
MDNNERLIIEELKNGYSEKLDTLIDVYGNKLKRTAYMMTSDLELAKDIVQECFISFYYNIHSYKGRCSLSTWLNKILINECRKQMRKSWFRKVISKNTIHEEITQVNTEDNDINRISINECILKLNEKDRQMILLHYYNDLKIKDISYISGCKEGTIKSRLKRARDKLIPILEEAGFNG